MTLRTNSNSGSDDQGVKRLDRSRDSTNEFFEPPPLILNVCLEGLRVSSGPSYSVVRLVLELNKQNLSVRLGGLFFRNVSQATVLPPFTTIFPVVVGLERLGVSPEMRRWIDRTVSNERVRLIHCHSPWLMAPVYSSRAAKRHSIQLVVSPRGCFSEWAFNSGSRAKPLFWRWLQRPALESVVCFHATSDSEFGDIRRLGFQQPVAVIPNGVDLPPTSPRLARHPRTLLFLGRLHPIKGLSNLLRAWQIVQDREPAWRLRIAGPNEVGHLAELQRIAHDLKLGRVEFVGERIGMAKWAEFNSADLFVLPSHSENFGQVVAEALAFGVPVVVSKGAPWELIESKRCGWWTDNGVESLVASLTEALSCPNEKLQVMGNRGRHWMAQEYSWPVIASKMATTYRWLIDGGDRPPWVRVD
jgi:glycosyltransferase involved in cell wall biosynthesis